MTITIEKKHLYVAGAILACILLVWGLVKTCGGSNYESKAKEMKLNAKNVVSLSLSILSDYQTNWNSAISDHRAKNVGGESEYVYDFNEAIEWRYTYYSKNGHLALIDSLVDVVKKDMKSMNNPPSKYKEVHSSLMEIYNGMNALVSLVKQPKGSLMSFGQNVNEISSNIEKAFLESDLTISTSEEDVLEKNAELMAYLMAKRIGEEKKHIDASLENVKVYKDKGYVPIEEGNNVLYKEITKGTGPIPEETSLVRVHYEGKTLDGEVFDSSYDKNPVDLRANQVIKGFTEALTHMPVGTKWEVFIPYDKAYQERSPGKIKPYSDLLFTIELLKIIEK